MIRHFPFFRIAALGAAAAAAFVLLTPALLLPARAQAARQAALSDAAKSDAAKPQASQAAATGNVASVNPANPRSRQEPHRQGGRQGEGSREIGQRHFQPRALPAAEGRRQSGRIAAACGGQAAFGRAGDDHRLRLVLDQRLWRDLAGLHLSQPARGATASPISERRHHRLQFAARAATTRRR